MTSNIQLENLNLSELNILLGHLRLGEAHLKKQLTSKQFHSLLNLGALDVEQRANISTNRAEKSGNVALVLNTIITSVFGAWMGFSAFMGMTLNSPQVLGEITLVALLTSLVVGYFSFKLTALNAQAAIHNQKIHNLQLNILNLIIFKQEESLKSIIKHLNYSLRYVKSKSSGVAGVEGDLYSFDNLEQFSQWIRELNDAILLKTRSIEKQSIYKFYCERLLKIIDTLENKVNLSLLINPNAIPESSGDMSELREKNSFLQILSKPQTSSFIMSPHKTWFRKNLLALIAGIVPTLLGGFASMFVFLAGGPNLAKDLGYMGLEHTLRQPHSRLVEFSIAVGLTLYYGISFVYNNYKTYVRQHEVEKTKRRLVLLDKNDVYLNRKLSILAKMKAQTRRIINIYTAIENIEQSLNEKKRGGDELTVSTEPLMQSD